MKFNRLFLVLICLSSLIACAENSSKSVGADSSAYINPNQPSKNEGSTNKQFLAYVHNLAVEIDEAHLTESHAKLISACRSDDTYKCAVMNASVNTKNRPTSKITLRVSSEGVEYFSSLASKNGKISSQSSSAEDLGDKIIDGQKRIEMLEAYRARLQELEAKPNGDINALIRIASELATTQNEIEYAKGKRARLLQRVELDILNITQTTPNFHRRYSPISEAIENFREELSYGIATIITASAYLFPWLVFLTLLFLALRFIIRWIRRRN